MEKSITSTEKLGKVICLPVRNLNLFFINDLFERIIKLGEIKESSSIYQLTSQMTNSQGSPMQGAGNQALRPSSTTSSGALSGCQTGSEATSPQTGASTRGWHLREQVRQLCTMPSAQTILFYIHLWLIKIVFMHVYATCIYRQNPFFTSTL